jgi:hypothetical protein
LSANPQSDAGPSIVDGKEMAMFFITIKIEVSVTTAKSQ